MSGKYGARVAVNTRLLYVRLAIATAINLFVVRRLVGSLGIEGYGAFSVACAGVGVFFFFRGALMSAARRFVCEDGLNFQPLLGLTLAIVATVGVTVVLVSAIRPAQSFAVQVFVLGMFALQTLRLPYEALIVAGERMGIFLVLSAVESALTLVAALAISVLPMAPLTAYAALRLAGEAVVWFLTFAYCRRRHSASHDPPVFALSRVRPLFRFFGWQTLGSVAVFLRAQGVVLLLAVYAGTGACAAFETGGTVMGILWGFVASYRTAYLPGIVKSWADGDRASFVGCTARAFRHSLFGAILVVAPILVWAPSACRLWIGDGLPPDAAMFVRMFVLQCFFEALATPLDTAILAIGRIARYEIVLSVLIGSSFALAWLFLSAGLPAWTSIGAAAFVNPFAFLYRFVHLKRHHGFAIRAWFCRSAA